MRYILISLLILSIAVPCLANSMRYENKKCLDLQELDEYGYEFGKIDCLCKEPPKEENVLIIAGWVENGCNFNDFHIGIYDNTEDAWKEVSGKEKAFLYDISNNATIFDHKSINLFFGGNPKKLPEKLDCESMKCDKGLKEIGACVECENCIIKCETINQLIEYLRSEPVR